MPRHFFSNGHACLEGDAILSVVAAVWNKPAGEAFAFGMTIEPILAKFEPETLSRTDGVAVGCIECNAAGDA